MHSGLTRNRSSSGSRKGAKHDAAQRSKAQRLLRHLVEVELLLRQAARHLDTAVEVDIDAAAADMRHRIAAFQEDPRPLAASDRPDHAQQPARPGQDRASTVTNELDAVPRLRRRLAVAAVALASVVLGAGGMVVSQTGSTWLGIIVAGVGAFVGGTAISAASKPPRHCGGNAQGDGIGLVGVTLLNTLIGQQDGRAADQ